jgi:hypothetical protein
MTKIQISLHDGMVLTADVENYDATEIASKMNDPKLLAIQVGEAVVNKNIVKLIVPVQA